MEKWIDLHTHSTSSDGSMSPVELVRHAAACGLAAVAVTDHDTVEGIEEALAEGEKQGIEVIPGLEISVDFKPEMHILGYFFNGKHRNIQGTLADLRAGRERRNVKIIAKLNDMGMAITMDEARAIAFRGIVGRPHIARALMNKGYVSSISDAFDRYLCSGCPAYFRREELSPEEGIGEILKAGGIPVLAHPIYLERSYRKLDELLEHLVKEGLKGLEAHYAENTKEDTGNLLRLAIKHNLLVTGGSDFHGAYKPHIEIGKGRGNLKIPYELLEKLKEG
jgi:3',5'-nucleoside bisphosphate phosphatase